MDRRPTPPHGPRRDALRAAAGAVALGGLAGAGVRPAAAATPADTLVIVREISSIAEWDPAVSQILDTQEINSDIYDRLVGYDPRKASGELGPALAESWTVTPDGTQFVFKVRRGVKFHSGNPLSAHDVAYTFKRIISLDREPARFLVVSCGTQHSQ